MDMGILRNLAVSVDALEHMRQLAWLAMNRETFVRYRINMRVNVPHTTIVGHRLLHKSDRNRVG